MELSGRDDLGQLFHVSRLDVDDVEALVLNVQVPEVYTQIIAAGPGKDPVQQIAY